jgi:hypothetical protein
MPHAKSLRAIGQSLESLGIVAFVMEKNGQSYIVRSDQLPEIEKAKIKVSAEQVLETPSPSSMRVHSLQDDGSIRYDPNYISWLDAQGRKKRRKRLSAQTTSTSRVSQLLRTLGKHLDQVEPHAFNISWTKDAVCLDYQSADGQQVREVFTVAKVLELTVRSRLRRAPRR